ncbi:MAG: site-2 protease family protein [Ruminococcaceae bacterium]|nr:site-2 protease family protein [Oscillospiraceae bacterium]
MMTGLWTAVAAIIIFCVLVFVHEFGHFLAAKALGIRVHEFAIGMGPKLFGKQKGETLYSVRALPIGGFCALEGEDASSDDERALSKKPAWAKFIVMVAGSVMNLLLGFLLLLCIYGTADQIVVPEIAAVDSGSAAEAAGVLPDDVVVSLDGRTVHIAGDLAWAKSKLTGAETELVVHRGSEKRTLLITPQQTEAGLSLGIRMKARENTFFLTVKTGFYNTFFYAKVVLETFVDLLRGRVAFQNLSGPIGIVSEIGTAVKETAETGLAGFLSLVQLTVLLTINLGVFNLLPIPALDGGRIFFVLVEMIRRKPLPPEKEGIVHMVGLVLLLLVSLVVAYMDVIKLLF